MQAPLQLRELNISFELFHLPKSIEQLKYLEKIELPNFKGTLPEEFFHLPSLKHLRLRAGMKSLPDSLGNFTNLQHIDLSGCEDLQTLPPSFGNLTKLQHVKLHGSGSIDQLHRELSKILTGKDCDKKVGGQIYW
jgi:Leucine-rich repeat (LRR) protein